MMRAPLAQLERLVREAAGRSTLSVIRTDLARDDAIEWVLEHLLHVDVDSASPDDRKLLAFIERKRRIAAATVDDAPGAPTAYGLVRHLGHELPMLVAGHGDRMAHVLDPYDKGDWISISDFDAREAAEQDELDAVRRDYGLGEHCVREGAADHVSGAVGGNMYGGHLQDEEFNGNVRRKRVPNKRFTAVDDSAYRQFGDGSPAGTIAEDDELDPYVGEGARLLGRLVREALSAQHTVYHTAPVYEDDDALDDVDEMSSGGVVGSAPGPSTKTEIVKRCGTGHGKKGKPWCLYSHKGKVLGHHPTAASAYGQERAIKAHGG